MFFFFNFDFPFFLISLGTLGSYLELNRGHIYNPCSWNSWIHPLFRGWGFAYESQGCKSPHMVFNPLSYTAVRREQTLCNNLGMTEGECQRLWSMVLKHGRVFWPCWSWTTRLEISWRKIFFFFHQDTPVDHGGPILVTYLLAHVVADGQCFTYIPS